MTDTHLDILKDRASHRCLLCNLGSLVEIECDRCRRTGCRECIIDGLCGDCEAG